MDDKYYEIYKNSSQKQINNALVCACRMNDFSTVEYLLTSSSIPFNAQIDAKDDEFSIALCAAVASHNNEIVKYLLTSPNLKQQADIHVANDSSFTFALIGNNKELMDLFIIELNIEKTDYIIDSLDSLDDDGYAQKLFDVRELNQELSKNLPMFESKSKVVKI
jgi:hypothetical protein